MLDSDLSSENIKQKKIGSKENVCYNTYGIIRSALYKYQAIENIEDMAFKRIK